MIAPKRTTRFRGRIISVAVEEVELPNGHCTQLEIVHHPGGAAVVAADRDDRICLLRQYRHAIGGWIWELPAGKLEPGEPPLATAQRELAEEAGRTARQWDSLGHSVSSPGVFDEVVHLFLATDLAPAAAAPESAEVFEVHWIALDEARDWALDGTASDAKTALGILRAVHRLRGTPGHVTAKR